MRQFIISFTALFLFTSCITEIDFEGEVTNFIVIGGVVSNSANERTIFVSRTTGVETLPEPIPATGVVYKDGELWAELSSIKIGELTVPFPQDLEVGSSYHIEITTADGKVYRTFPQEIQPPLETDSLHFGISTRVSGLNFKNEPILKPFVDVFATVNVPAPTGNEIRPNYRWQVDESWRTTETPDAIKNPIEYICYPTNDVSTFPSTVLDIDDLAPGPNQVLVAIRLLDESFLERHYFNVYLHTVDTRAIQYYQSSQRLIQNTGTIYDEVPALVKGNVFNIDDEQERVLGYVEFSLADTTRLKIDFDELNSGIFDFCRDAEDPCPFLPLPTGGVTRANCRCFECDSIYGQQTLIKPFYFED